MKNRYGIPLDKEIYPNSPYGVGAKCWISLSAMSDDMKKRGIDKIKVHPEDIWFWNIVKQLPLR